jgi:regulator of Ty1 transposition protein 103
LSHWCVFHRKRAKYLAPVWQKELRSAPGKRKLSFLYLANDVLQNSRKKGPEWIEALWPKMEWGMKHVIRGVSDTKTKESCAKLVKVWQERRIFGSRSLGGWLDAGADAGEDAADAAVAADAAPAPAPMVARRKEERLSVIPAALTGAHAALAKALEAVTKAICVLVAAEKTCATDLTSDLFADGFVENASDPEHAKRKLQAAESALSKRREALEETVRLRQEAASLAKEVTNALETAAKTESDALEESTGVVVQIATLRMKATRVAAAAMAVAAAREAGGTNKSKPGLEPVPVVAAVAPPAAGPMEEEYVPEGDEYVPEEVVAEDGAAAPAPDLAALLAESAANPEVLAQALAALPEEQREVFEAQLREAGVM